MVITPQLLAGFSIECNYMVIGQRNIHDPVYNYGRGLEARCHSALVMPSQGQFGNIAAIDLIQRREALIGVIAAEARPFVISSMANRGGSSILGLQRTASSQNCE